MVKCNAPWKNARQWSENGDPAWVQEELPKWKKVEEAQREMLRIKIFQLEAAFVRQDIRVGSRNFFGAAPRPRRADTLRPKAVYAMSRTVSSCISDDGIERINGVCWPNLASSVPAQSVGSHM